jgi:hypothetical protein
MKPRSLPELSRIVFVVSLGACVSFSGLAPAQQPSTTSAAAAASQAAQGVDTFDTPEQAADAIIQAADDFDVSALTKILGSKQTDVVLTGDSVQDKEIAKGFAARAHEQKSIRIDPKHANRAVLLVGNQSWPFPVPIVKHGGKWSFDGAAGREELLNRRIGGNELDAIAICRGFVEAQYDYAFQPREGYEVHEYAQRIISTPGTRDGLAWKDPDGSWGGPVGANVANAIEEGYTSKSEPYHGYFFKVLKKQGPAAPTGARDYIVKGVMIGGFALAAAPADYGRSGVKTFMVNQSGVVYEKDLGPATLRAFGEMQSFNPDKSWTPIAVTGGSE